MIPTLLWVSSPVSREKEDTMDDRTASEQDGVPATSGHGQGLKKEPCFQRDSSLPSPSVSLISQLLGHTMVSRGLDPHVLSPSCLVADLLEDYRAGASPGEGEQALALPRPCAPAPLPWAGHGEHLWAKRARVESIIQGMTLPTWDTGEERGGGHDMDGGRETPRESKRKPRVPQQQRGDGVVRRAAPGGGSSPARGCQQLKEQLRFLEQQLGQLQEKLFQLCDPGGAAHSQDGSEEAHPPHGESRGRAGRARAAAARGARCWGGVPEAAGREGPEQQQQQERPHRGSGRRLGAVRPSAGVQAARRRSLTPSRIQEVLTPGHLKKAKLMFFFTRYPSSALLKSYFPDVQFSRCITSQLIKWFSNFREFFYIQVEKFARQALLEGVADAEALRVSRGSELFRALNAHYNKGNDFEVPARFLDVASLALQEFFRAVRAGKDADPSWKKPIYKIISKLDGEIPAAFRSSGCSRELLRS
ncbi:prospero homeobox protein 2 [Rhea pennata]|uniref:prospero homeobox protein 2 n=1 Tax=Rhea pennata TaxID=8795 RepID=UPI002E2637E2